MSIKFPVNLANEPPSFVTDCCYMWLPRQVMGSDDTQVFIGCDLGEYYSIKINCGDGIEFDLFIDSSITQHLLTLNSNSLQDINEDICNPHLFEQ